MAIVINGSGTVTGLAVGGLPDGTVDAGTVAADVATQAEIDAKLNLAGGAMTGDVTLTTGSAPTIKVEETGGSYIEIEAGGSTGHIKSKSGHDITFSPGGTNHLQLYSSGRAKSQFTANAWVSFNAQGTAAIKDSHNVSSLGDQATGWFYVNIDANLDNANACAVGSASNSNNTYRTMVATAVQVVGAWYIMCSGHSTSTSVAAFDPELVYSVVFGD